MAEEGLLDLDATIDTYLPYFPKKNASRITVRHLLEHKSGIPHHFIGIPRYFEVHDKYFHTPIEHMKHFWDIELLHEPGEGLTYSSPGYYVLGIILETVSEKSYAELLEENIFCPLGMENSHVHNNRSIHKNMATGYQMSFLIFHRYDDEDIRDFKLENENVDCLLGSMFIRK